MLHSHQLAEKELKGHQLQQELTTAELTHEQAVSRLAHDDLLAAKMREEESQQLVVKLKEEVSEHKVDIASCIVFMITID